MKIIIQSNKRRRLRRRDDQVHLRQQQQQPMQHDSNFRILKICLFILLFLFVGYDLYARWLFMKNKQLLCQSTRTIFLFNQCHDTSSLLSDFIKDLFISIVMNNVGFCILFLFLIYLKLITPSPHNN